MSEAQSPQEPRTRILCLLRDGQTADALRWTGALAQCQAVELVDLAQPGLDYAALLRRIFAADRVISW